MAQTVLEMYYKQQVGFVKSSITEQIKNVLENPVQGFQNFTSCKFPHFKPHHDSDNAQNFQLHCLESLTSEFGNKFVIRMNQNCDYFWFEINF